MKTKQVDDMNIQNLTVQKVQELYLSYFNDFLTVPRFAEYYGLSEVQAILIIQYGYEIQEEYVSLCKALNIK